jgi:hypothetical protein
MRSRLPSCLLSAFLCILLAGPGAQTVRADEEYRTGRVADLKGNLSAFGDDEDDISYVERNAVVREGDTLWTDESGRAEIELERGTWVRLAEDTKLELVRTSPETELRLWTGSLYLDVSERVETPLRVKTPVGDVDVDPSSVVRIDLDKSESARVSVYNGRARLVPDRGEPVRLRAGERIYLEADRELDAARAFDREDLDGFDRYQRERVDYYIDRPLPRELDQDLLGARDLNDHGAWVTVEQERYWRPRSEPNWRPYSSGYWSYLPNCGYTWIDYAPWGYTTCHYGRWRWMPAYGWLWSPTYRWGPSWVHWSSYDNYYGWAPLDRFDRPCYYGGGNFSSLNLIIDFRSWTFCNRDRFFFGRHHRRFGRDRCLFGGNDLVLRRDNFRLVGDVRREIGIPRHHARGLTIGTDGLPARDRVLRVENRMSERRLGLIQNRFGVSPARDRQRALRPGETERLQRNPALPIDDGRVVRGPDAVDRPRRRAGGATTEPGGPRIQPVEPKKGTRGPGDDRVTIQPVDPDRKSKRGDGDVRIQPVEPGRKAGTVRIPAPGRGDAEPGGGPDLIRPERPGRSPERPVRVPEPARPGDGVVRIDPPPPPRPDDRGGRFRRGEPGGVSLPAPDRSPRPEPGRDARIGVPADRGPAPDRGSSRDDRFRRGTTGGLPGRGAEPAPRTGYRDFPAPSAPSIGTPRSNDGFRRAPDTGRPAYRDFPGPSGGSISRPPAADRDSGFRRAPQTVPTPAPSHGGSRYDRGSGGSAPSGSYGGDRRSYGGSPGYDRGSGGSSGSGSRSGGYDRGSSGRGDSGSRSDGRSNSGSDSRTGTSGTSVGVFRGGVRR